MRNFRHFVTCLFRNSSLISAPTHPRCRARRAFARPCRKNRTHCQRAACPGQVAHKLLMCFILLLPTRPTKPPTPIPPTPQDHRHHDPRPERLPAESGDLRRVPARHVGGLVGGLQPGQRVHLRPLAGLLGRESAGTAGAGISRFRRGQPATAGHRRAAEPRTDHRGDAAVPGVRQRGRHPGTGPVHAGRVRRRAARLRHGAGVEQQLRGHDRGQRALDQGVFTGRLCDIGYEPTLKDSILGSLTICQNRQDSFILRLVEFREVLNFQFNLKL